MFIRTIFSDTCACYLYIYVTNQFCLNFLQNIHLLSILLIINKCKTLIDVVFHLFIVPIDEPIL